MFTKLLALLLPLMVTGQIVGIDNVQRRFRQLDLGANEFPNEQNIDSQFIDPRLVNNAYLPPVSSTRPPPIRIASEPTQQNENLFINDNPRIRNYLAPPLVNNVKPLPASQLVTELKQPQNDIFTVSTPEPSVESRNYLPPQPEYSPAAQTPQGQAVPVPQKEDDHHHHHHHHHDENFDICSDAFHSFLCAPLKARKRITGAFPESLRGQASFNQYQKALPDRTPAPSNEFLNQYLPPDNRYLPPVNREPVRFDAPSNRIESTTLIPRTTQTPRTFPTTTFVPRTTQAVRTIPTTTYRYVPPVQVVADTSNANDRFYLPPLPEKKNDFFPRNPEPSNAVENVISRQPPFSSSSTIVQPEVTTFNTFRSSDTNKINSVVPTTRKPFVTTPSATTFNTFKTTQNFNSGSSFKPVSLSSTVQKSFSQSSFPSRPSSSVSYNSTPRINSPSTTAFTSSQNTFKFESSTFNSPQTSKFQSSFPSQKPQTVLSSVNNNFNPSKAPSQPTANFISTTLKSFSDSSSNSVLDRAASSLAPRPSLDNNYLPPESTFRSASNIISTTVKSYTPERKDTIVSTTKAPQNRLQLHNTFLPPLPDQQPEDRRNLCNDPFNSFLCANTNSAKIKPTPEVLPKITELELKSAPTSQSDVVNLKPSSNSPISSLSPVDDGYQYPKPEKVFPLPSEPKVTISSTTPKLITTAKPKPTTLEASEAKTFTGYSYSQPEPAFPLPSEVIETADTGYVYPKPEKVFPQPSEQKVVTEAVVVPSSTTLAPTTTTLAPSTTPVPSPTTPRPSPTTLSPSTVRPVTNKGYFYPKPQQSFELPQKKGYSYPKPENPLELPIEKEYYRPLFSESSTSSSSSSTTLDDLGSALFIPVNKLDKRSESTRTRRYGERLRKLERKSFF